MFKDYWYIMIILLLFGDRIKIKKRKIVVTKCLRSIIDLRVHLSPDLQQEQCPDRIPSPLFPDVRHYIIYSQNLSVDLLLLDAIMNVSWFMGRPPCNQCKYCYEHYTHTFFTYTHTYTYIHINIYVHVNSCPLSSCIKRAQLLLPIFK